MMALMIPAIFFGCLLLLAEVYATLHPDHDHDHRPEKGVRRQVSYVISLESGPPVGDKRRGGSAVPACIKVRRTILHAHR